MLQEEPEATTTLRVLGLIRQVEIVSIADLVLHQEQEAVDIHHHHVVLLREAVLRVAVIHEVVLPEAVDQEVVVAEAEVEVVEETRKLAP